MVYNLTTAANATNPLVLYETVNTASNNLLSYGFLVSVFFIMTMIMLRNNPPPESIFAASITCATLSLLLLAAEVLPVVWMVGFVVVAGASGISLYVNK